MVSWMIASVLAYDFLEDTDQNFPLWSVLVPTKLKYCDEFIPNVVQFFDAEAFRTMLDAQSSGPLSFKSEGDQSMKKLTLFKLLFVLAMALALYGKELPSPTNATCPPICPHLTCPGGHAHCNSRGQCVCP